MYIFRNIKNIKNIKNINNINNISLFNKVLYFILI